MPEVVPAFLKQAKNLIEKAISPLVRTRIRAPICVAFSKRWLHGRRLRAELSDKDGVFVLVGEHALITMLAEQLRKTCYRAVGTLSLEPLYVGVREVPLVLRGVAIRLLRKNKPAR